MKWWSRWSPRAEVQQWVTYPEPTELLQIGSLTESTWTQTSKSNTLTPKSNSQKCSQRAISHVMGGTIFSTADHWQFQLRSHKLRARIQSNLNPASKETAVCFLQYPTYWNKCMTSKNAQCSPRSGFRIFTKSPAKSESWNSPNLHCLAVLPTWQWCLYSHTYHLQSHVPRDDFRFCWTVRNSSLFLTVWLPNMHNVPPEVNFESSRSPAKSYSWNSPNLHWFAVLTT